MAAVPKDNSMHFTISAIMRIALATLMLLGVCLFVLLGLLSIVRELLADEHHPAHCVADDDSRLAESPVPQLGLQSERR
jgi:hypothetical protein